MQMNTKGIPMKPHFLRALLAACALAFSSQAPAQDKDWPQHPVKIVVPFQAGSATDLISRQLGAALSAELGQPFVIEARPARPQPLAAPPWPAPSPTATPC
ncbi:putative secreted protein [Bordetella holmesii ATCC 51541]|nr:putative secreted protein [Bordetella holmesii ATCC 51541]